MMGHRRQRTGDLIITRKPINWWSSAKRGDTHLRTTVASYIMLLKTSLSKIGYTVVKNWRPEREPVYAICCRPEADGDSISGRNVKTIKGWFTLW